MRHEFPLSEEERSFFFGNGYVGPFTLYEPQEMKRVWDTIRMDILDTQNAAFPDSRLNYDRHLDIVLLDRIVSDPRIVDRVSSILGPNILTWRTEWFPKYPGDEGTDWHQAESFVEFEGTEKLVPTEAEEGRPWELTAWVAMSEASKANGCLKFMPGTHRIWYFDEKRNIRFEPERINQNVLSDGHKSGFYGYDFEKLKLDRNWKPDESQAVHMEMKPGQFVIFTSRCMHGSNPNATASSVRFGWATRFVPTHVQVYPGQESFHHFGEELPLSRYSTVLVAGADHYGHNRIRNPLSLGEAPMRGT